MRTRLRVGVAWCGALVLAGVGWSGCGGGGSRLSTPDYVREASGICAAANRAIGRVAIPAPDDARSSARVIGRVVLIQRRSIDGLRGLRPPERLGSLNQRWIALLDQATDELDHMRTSLVDGKARLATDYGGNAVILLERARVLVSDHGVTSCRGPTLTVD